MEQQDHESKHACKYCNESFSSGRILGGHMRNHLGRNSAKEKVKLETCDKGYESYGLRENPKKSWKSSGVNHTDTVVSVEENVQCGVCGKQFGSPRSLNGHMRHHTVEERNGVRCKECGKGFRSLRSLTGHMKQHSGKQKVNGEEQSRPNLVSMALSDSDTVSLVRKKKRSNRTRYKANTPNSNSSYCCLNSDFDDEQEAEEVALCLMLLSRGFVELGNSFEAKSLNPNDVFCAGELAKKKPRREILDSSASDSKDQIFECSDCEFDKALNVELEVPTESESGSLFQINESEAEGEDKIEKRIEFQCRICNKNFAKYQALGGHQTFHRTTKSFTDSKTEETSKLEFTKDAIEEQVNEEAKNKEHKCHICCRNFESGQALGGHKRAHIAKAKEEANTEVKQDKCNIIYDAIDSGSNRIEPWWDGGSYKHESLVVDVMTQAKNAVVSF